MIIRIIKLLLTKFLSLFQRSIAFSAQVEYSKVSRKAKVWNHCKLFHVEVGDYSYIGPNTRLIHTHVGKYCSIAGDCAIGMGTHSLEFISTSSLFTVKKNGTGIRWTNSKSFEEFKEIEIGNDVWIGQRAMIMGGVKIGNGAVIGAGALVTKDVPPYAIVVGVPAKLIRFRFPEDVIKKLETTKWWLLEDCVLKENIYLFQNPLTEKNIEKLIDISSGYKQG